MPGKLEILKSWEENPEQGVASGKDCEGKNVKGDSETMTAKANNEEYKADVEKSSWRSEILLTITGRTFSSGEENDGSGWKESNLLETDFYGLADFAR